MTAPIDPDVTDAVSQQSGVPPAEVDAVLTAYNTVAQGDPLGTIRRGPEGEIALRLVVYGVPQWGVVVPSGDGGFYYDTQALTDWPIIDAGS
jgi:hypothetical protein